MIVNHETQKRRFSKLTITTASNATEVRKRANNVQEDAV